MSYRHVIWDWNGTLLDDVGVCVEVANDILRDFGLSELTRTRYREIFDFPVSLYWERAGLDLEQAGLGVISRRFTDTFEDLLPNCPLFPQTEHCLGRIESSGIAQYVLSNTEQQALHRMLSAKSVANYFEAARGTGDIFARGKAEAGQALVDEQAIPVEQAVLVGDTLHDAQVAVAMGCDCILIDTGHHSRERLLDAGVPVVSSLGELPERLGVALA